MKPKAAQESEGKRNWVRDQVYSVIQQRALGLSMFSCISCGPSYIARNALSLCKSPSLLFSVPLDPGEMTPSLLSHWSPLWGGGGVVKGVEQVWNVYSVFCTSTHVFWAFFIIWLFGLRRHTEG